jgi:ATP-dependent protease ClpP protease subunit
MAKTSGAKKKTEIALIGDVDDWEADAVKQMLELPSGSEVVFYIDSAGGSVYGAVAVFTLMRQRRLRGTAVVLGECSSAALLIFAACEHRQVTRLSTLMFHRMRWQSEKRVVAEEAHRWAQHFDELEKELDRLQARLFGVAFDQVRIWTDGSFYVTGTQIAEAGLAELLTV